MTDRGALGFGGGAGFGTAIAAVATDCGWAAVTGAGTRVGGAAATACWAGAEETGRGGGSLIVTLRAAGVETAVRAAWRIGSAGATGTSLARATFGGCAGSAGGAWVSAIGATGVEIG